LRRSSSRPSVCRASRSSRWQVRAEQSAQSVEQELPDRHAPGKRAGALKQQHQIHRVERRVEQLSRVPERRSYPAFDVSTSCAM